MEFYSPGKLLITSEYCVLDGAKALALPTKKGQWMKIEPIAEPLIHWKSYTHTNTLWINAFFSIKNFDPVEANGTELFLIDRIQMILKTMRALNPEFCSTGYRVTTTLEFNQQWGLGSSSTLIYNLSQWAQVNPFELLDKTFGGSGYDVAVAKAKQSIYYTRNEYNPTIEPVCFNPPFKKELFFIYLNKKQHSQKEVKAYYERHKKLDEKFIQKINDITIAIAEAQTLSKFNDLIEEHEDLIGSLLNQSPIKKRLFHDFEGKIKSLGAWGGDFILATGLKSPLYFKEKGFETIQMFDELISSEKP